VPLILVSHSPFSSIDSSLNSNAALRLQPDGTAPEHVSLGHGTMRRTPAQPPPVVNRGDHRIGIVIGNMYLLTGCWSTAITRFAENADRARRLGDAAWYAKALENIIVCIILLSWSKQDFEVCHDPKWYKQYMPLFQLTFFLHPDPQCLRLGPRSPSCQALDCRTERIDGTA